MPKFTPAQHDPSNALPMAYCEGLLDRASALRTQPEALKRLWTGGNLLVFDEKGHIFFDTGGNPLQIKCSDLEELSSCALFLGLYQDIGWFAVATNSPPKSADKAYDMRFVAHNCSPSLASVIAYASSVLQWQVRTRFCSQCGAILERYQAGHASKCSGCAVIHWPQVTPAVIVAVSYKDCLLLGRQASWPLQRYSVLAGFVEPGETLEQTVVREVCEETGVQVDLRSCRYVATQPWPFPSHLMLGFTAWARNGSICCPSTELEDAQWFSRQRVGEMLARNPQCPDGGEHAPPAFSISHALIASWYAQ